MSSYAAPQDDEEKRTVYVAGFLPSEEQLVRDLMASYGAIKLATFKWQDETGYAFIAYEEPPHATAALSAGQSRQLTTGTAIQLKQYCRKRVTEVDPKKCYVGNLPADVQDDEFAQYFLKWGALTAEIPRKHDNAPRGYGFCNFGDQKTAEACAGATHMFRGTIQLEVRMHGVRPIVTDQEAVFVGGLPHECTEEILEQYFAAFGQIQQIKLLRQENGALKGFGFVIFDSVQAVESCLANRDHHYILDKWVDVKRPSTEPKGKGKGKGFKGKGFGKGFDGKGKGKKGGGWYDAYAGPQWGAPAVQPQWGGGGKGYSKGKGKGKDKGGEGKTGHTHTTYAPGAKPAATPTTGGGKGKGGSSWSAPSWSEDWGQSYAAARYQPY